MENALGILVIAVLEAHPALVAFLRPRLHRRWGRARLPASETPETTCRVSLYFNSRGQELTSRRYIGTLAGPITVGDCTAG